MRAAVTLGPLDIRIKDDLPEPVPGPGDAIIRVGTVGLCGTDLHMFAGERADTGFPLRQGHEVGGTVAALPSGYDGPLQPGQTVALDPSVPCGRCRPCTRGAWPHCAHFTAVGVARPGGLAELVAAPVTRLHDASGLSAEEAALVEPFSIAAMALSKAELRGDERILVTGAGPIGLAIIVAARRRDVPVMVTDTVPARLAVAEELGAERTVNARDGGLADAVAQWTRGHGADVAIEASGAQPALGDCVASLGRGGRLVVVGVAAHDLTISVPQVLFAGISVVGARAGLVSEAVRIVTAERAAAARLVSHRFPLSHVAEAFALATDRPHDVIKVLITVDAPTRT